MHQKDEGAFLTIGEVSAKFGIAAHILRYWETKFTGLRPLQRSGNRRYYRPVDVDMVENINRLLNQQGYTVSGAARLLSKRANPAAGHNNNNTDHNFANANAVPASGDQSAAALPPHVILGMEQVRTRLAAALAAA
jgi:DNA-binding transcriptional MerR regulator